MWEVSRLARKITDLESDNRLLQKALQDKMAVITILKNKIEHLEKRNTELSWGAEALRSQIPTNHEMGQ